MPPSRRRSPLVPGVAALLGAGALAVTLWTRPAPPAPAAPPPPPPADVPATAVPSAVPTARPVARSSPPVRVEIPAIGVRAEVMRLGTNPDGTLEVPPLSQADRTGWYERGAAPGTAGPAVIVGHVDTATGPAVFARLGDLRPGDRVRVVRADGKVATYRLDRFESVRKTAFPTERVYGDLPYAAIRLITCGGAFDRGSGHYVDNLIAYGHLTSVR
ncbi:class F sortase [Nonomuraea pusilla]|uniref:Sortase family protein n=1 Tax=Nonomuraea pusilla TaxID=46177 RepID=A0A1H8H771_9ACTN|nr:class F sortase [Nonomuraea pusilla]SEN52113.1 Sortase family protein [Nonomuraea pusilla]